MEGRDLRIEVFLGRQILQLWRGGLLLDSWPVSTALNGPGELRDTGCTPRGLHHVRLRIGEGCPRYTVFEGRRPTGEIWTPELGRQYPGRDWILTRILWLTGDEPGFNRGGDCDTLRRYIYIHGTAEEGVIGKPVSHGCIRMKNKDIEDLFNLVYNGTPVHVQE